MSQDDANEIPSEEHSAVPPPPPQPVDSSESVASPVTETADARSDEAVTRFDEGQGRVFPCQQCGADIVFHIGLQTLTCPYCDYSEEIDIPDDQELPEFDFKKTVLERAEREPSDAETELDLKELTCQSCAGTIQFQGTLTSTECPYCGTPVQRNNVHDAPDRIPATGVLPFQVTQNKADQQLKAWVQSLWFAPNDFLKRGVEGHLQGIYLPYWTYDSLTFNRYSGQKGVTYTKTVGSGKNRRTVTKVRWYPASGRFQRFFDDVLVIACTGQASHLLIKLEPWPLQQCQQFNQQSLAGFLARTYDIELENGFQLACSRIDEALRADVRRRIGGDRQRIHNIDTSHQAITYKHLLLPVWMMGYKYQGKSYQVVINGATGEVQGDRPYSFWKIALTVLVFVSIAGGIFFLVNS